MISTAQVALSVTPVQLCGPNRSRSGITIAVPASVTLFIGGPDVTALNGFPVTSAAPFVDTPGQDEYWGVLASSTSTAYVLQRK